MARAAVLVGINRYWFRSWPDLEWAERDCRELGDALCQARFGFARGDIRILTASDGAPWDQPFRNNLLYGGLFGPTANGELDLFVFYFAGHGVEWNGESYLVPADGVPERVGETCVPFASVLDRITSLPAKQRVLIFDVCRRSLAGTPPGLPASFVRDAQRVRDAAVLCACDHGELSHEDSRLPGGVFTHYWCRALNGGAEPREGALTAFEVQRYAEDEVRRWAARNGCKQSPRTFLANCSTLYLSPPEALSQPVPVRQWLHGPESRTENIVSVLSYLTNKEEEFDSRKYFVRIKAQVSSFAMTEKEHPTQPRLGALLLDERRLLTTVLEKGASFKVIVGWDLERYLRVRDMPAALIEARLGQLRTFCERVLNNPEWVSRFTAIRLPSPERNLLVLGSSYLFEGRKLRVQEGFDATQVFTDADATGREIIGREIKMYDEHFDNAVEYVCEERAIPRARRAGSPLNQRLLEALIEDLSTDLKNPELQTRLNTTRAAGGEGGG